MKMLKYDFSIDPNFKPKTLVRIKGTRPVGKIVQFPGCAYGSKSVEFKSPDKHFYLTMDIPIKLLEKVNKSDRFIYALSLNKNNYEEIKELRNYVNKKKQEMRNDL